LAPASQQVASDGWDLALSFWRPYAERLGMESDRSIHPAAARHRRCRDSSGKRPHHRQSALCVTKGAFDRLVLASAHELSDLNLRANVINPGPIDTG